MTEAPAPGDGSPLSQVLGAALRPLRFAAGSGWARIDRVRDLEETVLAAIEQAGGLRIPADAKALLERSAGRMRNVREADTDAKRQEQLESVYGALERLAGAAYAQEALARSVSTLPGVGPKRAESLARRGLGRIEELLLRLPSRYDDRSRLANVATLEVGRRATFVGDVRLADFIPGRGRGRGRRAFQAVVGDETGTVNLKWFRGGEQVQPMLRKGARVLVTGDVKRYRFSKELVHPEVQLLADGDAEAPTTGIVADYGSVEGVAPRTLRRSVELAIEHHADLLAGELPDEVVRQRDLPGMAAAVTELHRPRDAATLDALLDRRGPAFERLILEELYPLLVGLALRRERRAAEVGTALGLSDDEARALVADLPFRLTAAQARAWGEIRSDLARPHPMQRLLQGDVGSGKTAVALLAARAVAARGAQAALMAPTELLAEQHERTIRKLAGDALRTVRLTSGMPRAEAKAARAALVEGEADLVVGTHALLQAGVAFARLGLAIVDEQHRFGVLQRLALGARGEDEPLPHTLVMTATPIPRTLALTVYGDLDLSVIDELPPGRRPVTTDVLRTGEGHRVMQLLHETLDRGEQAYVVYPLVEETERSDLRAATEQAERIRAALPEASVDLVHGRQGAEERAGAMARFESGKTQILVSTTVIEVGVDVANATLMIVDHAERFGLAQLHQLRGRVGRGERPGTCILVARGSTADSEARLRAMLDTTDGFRIADADLKIRGPGEFLGTRQHGHLPDLRIADLVRDGRLVGVARGLARQTLERDPGLGEHPGLLRTIERRWGERLQLVDVG